jgi:hypothetical protein
MKQSVLLSCTAFLLGSCNNAWNIAETPEVVILPGASAVVGRHCESSAIMNALNYQGYPIEESLITGAGGALGFGFDRSPFPFIYARNGDMREQFFKAAGIPWQKSADDLEDSPDYGWKQIHDLLSQGLPVILRVDMRYLPYLYAGKYGPAHSSFGWHMICLFGIDWSTEEALVSDTAMPGMQTIALKDLHKARSSKLKVMPPQGEFYWITETADSYTPDWEKLLRHSLGLVTGYYEDHSLVALQRYGQDLVELETYSKQGFLLPAVFDFMAGNIEDFGTGGAAFRMLYRDFLQLVTVRLNTVRLESALATLDGSIEAWHQLATAFRSLAGRIKGMKADQRALEYQKLKTVADAIYNHEKLFYAELKTCLQEN